jgi:hypothetical protein
MARRFLAVGLDAGILHLHRMERLSAPSDRVEMMAKVGSRPLSLEFTGLAQNLGQLEGSCRDFQSHCWVSLRIFGSL